MKTGNRTSESYFLLVFSIYKIANSLLKLVKRYAQTHKCKELAIFC